MNYAQNLWLKITFESLDFQISQERDENQFSAHYKFFLQQPNNYSNPALGTRKRDVSDMWNPKWWLPFA